MERLVRCHVVGIVDRMYRTATDKFANVRLLHIGGARHSVCFSGTALLTVCNNGCLYDLFPSAGQRHARVKATAQRTSTGQPLKYGLMIECDGVLVDIHKDCHRVAFNMAFEVSFV